MITSKNISTIEKEEAMSLPLFNLTVGAFFSILEERSKENAAVASDTHSVTGIVRGDPTAEQYVYGIKGLANLLGCSVPTASRIKSSGVLDSAITQYNRIIMFNKERVFELLKKQ